MTYRPKRCGNNNKDEDNSRKTLNDKNQQASSQKFRQQTPEEGRRTYRPKRYGNNNKDEDNSPKTLKEKNQPASFQKFRELIIICYMKPSSWVQIIYITLGYLMNRITNVKKQYLKPSNCVQTTD